MIAARLGTCALAAATVLALAHVLARAPGAELALSRTPPAEVTPALRERLARLDADLLLTYAASPEETLPSDLRGVPREVEALLRAIERAAREAGSSRVRVQIVDPTAGGLAADVVHWLEAAGLAPFQARALELDRPVDRTVWSSLRIARGAGGAAVIRDVTRASLPGLQALLAAHLDLLASPRKPRVALAAPQAFQALRRALRARAELLECDFGTGGPIPAEADLLVWIEPDRADPAQVEALRALLERGGSAVIAEGPRTPAALPAAFGLAAVDAVLLEDGPGGATPLVRSIGSDQDFRALVGPGARGQPNGSLLFAATRAFVPAAGRLRELGLALFPLASSPAGTLLRRASDDPSSPAARAPHATLLALLAPEREPGLSRRGSLVFAGSASPFSDEYLRHEAFAHEALLDGLVGSLASPERLAIASADLPSPPSIPELSAETRALVTALVTLAVPLLLLAPVILRGIPRPRIRLSGTFAAAATAAVAVLLLARFAPAAAALDLTRDGRNGLAPETRAILGSLGAPARIELVVSGDADLPPGLRASVRDARALARRLAGAAADLEVVDVAPPEDDTDALAALARDGVLPLDAPGPRRRFASIRVRTGGRSAVLPLASPASFEHLEFRLASALSRLASGARAPRVAVLASAPRPTPAEALAFQQRGLFPPGGGDPFGEARALLDANDLAVAALDPAQPEDSSDADLLLCLEPRRDARPMIAAAAQRLARGGNVLLAAQHFGVRARPALGVEPWFPDVDRLYFPSIGIDLARAVLLDDLSGAAEVETEAGPERRASPLFVRATPAGFDRDSPVLRGVGELVLECPSAVRVDPERLAALGIEARELVATSARTWAYDWKGGDLPDAVLRGPSDGRYLGPRPVAVLFEGRFPPPGDAPDLAAAPGGEGRGRLLLVGCSEIFRDAALRAEGGDAAQFLLNSVAALALAPDLVAILARRSAVPAIGLVAPRTKVLSRIGVVGAAPAVLALLALLRARSRRAGTEPAR